MAATIGILAVQGDVEAHARAVERLGASPKTVLRASDLDASDALILPGGESTTISKGLDRLELWEPIRRFVAKGRPVLGTCAGAILLSRRSRNAPVPTLGIVDVIAERNAYGTQVDSFGAPVDPGAGSLEGLFCCFIRAPRFRDPGPEVEVLARVDGAPVLLRQGRVVAASFHPELTADLRVHALLLDEGAGAAVAAGG